MTPKSQPQLLAFPDAEGYQLLRPADIVYCRAEGNYTRVFTQGGRQLLVTRKLREVEDKLQKELFLRVHHSYIVNLNYAERYNRGDGGSIKMQDNTAIPVARNKKNSLIELLKEC